jgi:hypothetical protein
LPRFTIFFIPFHLVFYLPSSVANHEILLAVDSPTLAVAHLVDSTSGNADPARHYFTTLLYFGTPATRAALAAVLSTVDPPTTASQAFQSQISRFPVGPLRGACVMQTTDTVTLQGLLATLRRMISRRSTPADLPDDINIYCFVSRLHSLYLTARPATAPPDVFRLFTSIHSLIPPPPLIDAICTAIDTVLRQPTRPR